MEELKENIREYKEVRTVLPKPPFVAQLATF